MQPFGGRGARGLPPIPPSNFPAGFGQRGFWGARMPINSRNKGAAFERKVAGLLHDELGITFQRDLDQYRASDRGDLIAEGGFPWLIECKVTQDVITACKPAWWKQASSAALSQGVRPVVIWKTDRRDIRCTVNLRDVMECVSRRRWSAENHLIELPLKGFVYIARESLADV